MKWTPSRDVRVKFVKRVKSKYKDTGHQILDNLLGVTVPVNGKRGVVVMPVEFRSGSSSRQFIKIDPTTQYLIVPEKHLELLGEAYAEEVAIAKRACRVHRLRVSDPDALRMRRVRHMFDTVPLNIILEANAQADERKRRAARKL
jgi:hypothetical protein